MPNASFFTKNSTYDFADVTMQKGCPKTRAFAERSGIAMSLRGVSMVISDDPHPDALREAIAFLQGQLMDAKETA